MIKPYYQKFARGLPRCISLYIFTKYIKKVAADMTSNPMITCLFERCGPMFSNAEECGLTDDALEEILVGEA